MNLNSAVRISEHRLIVRTLFPYIHCDFSQEGSTCQLWLTISEVARTLEEGTQYFASCLQQRVACYNLQETLKSLSSLFDDIVGKAVREYLQLDSGLSPS